MWFPTEDYYNIVMQALVDMIPDTSKYHIDRTGFNDVDYPNPTWELLITFYDWGPAGGVDFMNSIAEYTFDPYYVDANSVVNIG